MLNRYSDYFQNLLSLSGIELLLLEAAPNFDAC